MCAGITGYVKHTNVYDRIKARIFRFPPQAFEWPTEYGQLGVANRAMNARVWIYFDRCFQLFVICCVWATEKCLSLLWSNFFIVSAFSPHSGAQIGIKPQKNWKHTETQNVHNVGTCLFLLACQAFIPAHAINYDSVRITHTHTCARNNSRIEQWFDSFYCTRTVNASERRALLGAHDDNVCCVATATHTNIVTAA